MDKPDDKIIDDLRAAHPDREIATLKVKVRSADGGEDELYYFAARLPIRAEWNRFREAALDDDRRATATEDMVKSVIVFPPAAEFMKLLKKRPALVQTIGNQVSKLVGASTEVEVGNW